MRRIALTPLLALLIASISSAGTITGRVFVDANGDGQYQPSEAPVTAFLSDGVTIEASGADGSYALQAPDGPQIVFVVNPSGTWPQNGFYRHVPTGAGTADFPLVRQDQPLPFYFLQATDLHVIDTCAPYMQQYVQTVNTLPLPLAFVVHTGDLVRDTNTVPVAESERLFKLYQQMVSGIQPPLLNVPGNHEHAGVSLQDVPADTPGRGKALYRQYFGPMYYAFNYAGVHFIALDGTDLSSGALRYGIPRECLQWFESYLQKLDPSEPLVILIHEPISTLPQRAQVAKLLEGRNFLVALSGHGHGISNWKLAGGVEIMAGTTSYAWHDALAGPNAQGYHLVKISADGFESAFGDWAERYPVTVATPVRNSIITEPTEAQIKFLDLKNEVTSAEISLGQSRTVVQEFPAEGLYRTFSAVLDPMDLPDGVHELQITLQGRGEPMVERQPFLVMAGHPEPFAAKSPATLRMRLHGVHAANVVKLNGQTLGAMPADAKERQFIEFPVPAELLKRLNVVELTSAPLADGTGCDDFRTYFVSLVYEGKTAMDPRSPSIGVSKSPEPATATAYIDLAAAK